MVRRAQSLNELAGVSDYDVFTKAEMNEFKEKIEKKFGGFGRKEMNQFYDTGNIALIIWEMRVKTKDGHITQPLVLGKIIMPYAHQELTGKRIWKDYICRSTPFEFYEELYRQTNAHLARMEYGEKQNAKMFDKMAQLEESFTQATHE